MKSYYLALYCNMSYFFCQYFVNIKIIHKTNVIMFTRFYLTRCASVCLNRQYNKDIIVIIRPIMSQAKFTYPPIVKL